MSGSSLGPVSSIPGLGFNPAGFLASILLLLSMSGHGHGTSAALDSKLQGAIYGGVFQEQ